MVVVTHSPEVQGRPSLVCRLSQHRPGDDRRAFGGVVEITNTTQKVIRIPWDHHPLQYLDLQVLNEGGEELGELRYGHLFSPIGETAVLLLKPNETYTHPVHLLGTVPKAKWKAGVYTIRACYRVGEYVAQAKPIQITVTEQTVRAPE
jgi:hypothetical protein